MSGYPEINKVKICLNMSEYQYCNAISEFRASKKVFNQFIVCGIGVLKFLNDTWVSRKTIYFVAIVTDCKA